ncbi:hypothetical protein ABEB36_007154 [Hypothenemus hampei]|uniref:Amine oxidase domain-containing protein n=1 Tax=Hypothenemus hampei TaxID=57062 RepID=A0ABD1ETJ5_HYPHA
MRSTSVRFLVVLMFSHITSAFTNNQNNVSIVIIGAGAAGIAAATRLMEHTFTNVQILEAEDYIGGRVRSVEFGDAYVDLGAEYCHGQKDNVVYELAKNYLASEKPELVIHYSENGEPLPHKLQETLLNISHTVSHRSDNSSLPHPCKNVYSEGSCLDYVFKFESSKGKIKHELWKLAYEWLKSYASATESAIHLDDVSLISEYEELEGDQMLTWQGQGFKTIFNIMTNDTKLNVKFKTKVVKILDWTTDSQLILVEDGYNLTAKHVIFTPSLGVLKSTHEKLFYPSLLDERRISIDQIGFGVLVKVALYFNKSWWSLDNPKILACMWSRDHDDEMDKLNLRWLRQFVAFTRVEGNPNVLMAWFAGEKTPQIESLAEEELLKGISFLLKCFTGTYSNVSMPSKLLSSKWLANLNFRGAFSFDAVKAYIDGLSGLREALGSPTLSATGMPTLLFAGEATHPKRYATVHGAIESGYREADRLIKYYKSIKS